MRLLTRELSLARPYRWLLIVGALFACLAIGSGIGLMAVSAYLISKAALATNVAELALAITGVRVLAIARAAFRYLERVTTHRATFRILADVRAWFYDAIEPLAPAVLQVHRSGDLLSRIVSDVDSLEDVYVRLALPPVVAIIVCAVATVALGSFDPLLGLVLLGFLVLTGVVLPVVGRHLSRPPSVRLAAARGDLGAALLDEVQGLAELLMSDSAEAHRAQVLAKGRELDRIGERIALVRGATVALGAMLASLAGLSLVGLGVPLVTGGQLDGVLLAVLPLAAVACFEAVVPLPTSLQLLDTTSAAAARLQELAQTPPAVIDPPSPAPLPVVFDVLVEGLGFRYPDDPDPVFEGFDLVIPAGGTLGLMGPSGSGKSTLVSLLVRFREIGQGSIRIGGRDIRELAADELRTLIAVVPQDVHLFDTTVRDNLAVAHPEATDAELEAACRVAGVHDDIVAMPLGYRTRVGEDGVALSGGERQRLGIARAVLKDAPILVLDEATANLDEATEQAVLDGLTGFLEGRTVLLISHRAAVVARADHVVRLDA